VLLLLVAAPTLLCWRRKPCCMLGSRPGVCACVACAAAGIMSASVLSTPAVRLPAAMIPAMPCFGAGLRRTAAAAAAPSPLAPSAHLGVTGFSGVNVPSLASLEGPCAADPSWELRCLLPLPDLLLGANR
jgi:hypothetical protein